MREGRADGRGSTRDMIRMDGGPFLMGTETDQGFPADGEGPVRRVHVDPFYVDAFPVTVESFGEFVTATRHVT